MPAIDALIAQRRSIRKYKPEMPPEEHIREMIRCAAWAPSPSGSQPLKFFRIESPEVRNRLLQAVSEGRETVLRECELRSKTPRIKNWVNMYWRYSLFMFEAPVLLAVATLTSVKSFSMRLYEAGMTEQDHRGELDLALCAGFALDNLFLKAEELGLGTCILTAPLSFVSSPEQILGIEDAKIMAFATVGFPAETPKPAARKPIEETYIRL